MYEKVLEARKLTGDPNARCKGGGLWVLLTGERCVWMSYRCEDIEKTSYTAGLSEEHELKIGTYMS
jgi:hypothetical protein